MNNAIVKALNCFAIDKTARVVASQRGCEAEYSDLSRDELVQLLARLCRKQRLIHAALGFKTKKQAENLKVRIKAGHRTKKFDGRLAQDFVRTGDNISAVERRISELPDHTGFSKEVRKQIGAIENRWRAEHPGCIWDGRQLVAPSGAVFSRWVAAQSIGVPA